jgi:hypothetical protein
VTTIAVEDVIEKLIRNWRRIRSLADMILPCVLAMDKTHNDLPGRLQMEPITISHGLLRHERKALQCNFLDILIKVVPHSRLRRLTSTFITMRHPMTFLLGL